MFPGLDVRVGNLRTAGSLFFRRSGFFPTRGCLRGDRAEHILHAYLWYPPRPQEPGGLSGKNQPISRAGHA